MGLPKDKKKSGKGAKGAKKGSENPEHIPKHETGKLLGHEFDHNHDQGTNDHQNHALVHQKGRISLKPKENPNTGRISLKPKENPNTGRNSLKPKENPDTGRKSMMPTDHHSQIDIHHKNENPKKKTDAATIDSNAEYELSGLKPVNNNGKTEGVKHHHRPALMTNAPSRRNTLDSTSDTDTNDSEKFEAMAVGVEFPSPYWEEKIAKSRGIFHHLEKIPELKKALKENPRLAEEFMKHPDVAKEVVKDPQLGRRILARPELLQELALVQHEITEGRFSLGSYKRNSNNDPKHPHYHEHDHHPDKKGNPQHLNLGESESSSTSSDSYTDLSLVSKISRATLPEGPTPPGGPESLKYLVDSSRLFMTHHVEIADAFCWMCDRKRQYYDVLNVFGRVIYRVYETTRRICNCGLFTSFQMAVKEPDGTIVILMTKELDFCRSMRKIAVYCPPGNFIGSVEEKWGICNPKIVLRNADNDAMIDILVVHRPFSSRFRYNPDFEFELRTIGDHNSIGKISAEWLDLPPGAFPSEKVYGVSFPKELNCNVKMIVMTAWFLVYKLYFDGRIKRTVKHDLAENERDLLDYAAVPEPPIPVLPSDSVISEPP